MDAVLEDSAWQGSALSSLTAGRSEGHTEQCIINHIEESDSSETVIQVEHFTVNHGEGMLSKSIYWIGLVIASAQTSALTTLCTCYG
ncbi:hypothetical protein VTL71DRAFT_290 [Oculimacula yallundae]|uniref:Uncharacterized protein n=1 Tax=Oculimacula yallundae TaxID=86028 RepID=A0ABR4D0J5_9HELO